MASLKFVDGRLNAFTIKDKSLLIKRRTDHRRNETRVKDAIITMHQIVYMYENAAML